MAKKQEHPGEKFIRLLEDQFQADLETLDAFLLTDGRPMFTEKLTDEEQLAWWLDLAHRVTMEENILTNEGPEKLAKFVAKMRLKEAEYRGRMAEVTNG